MEIIYCGGGNRRFYEIATGHGFLYGAQLPDTVYGDLWFADQDWKKPNRERYMTALKQHRPHMASVLDLESESQFDEVISWAEEAAQWVEIVMIIPKVFGAIDRLPRRIAGAEVRLGYSVPTQFGGTSVPAWEFAGWPVHLLGGQPQEQMRLASYFDTASVDGNYFQMKATRFCEYWTPRGWRGINHEVETDAPCECFRRSCENIMKAWKN